MWNGLSPDVVTAENLDVFKKILSLLTIGGGGEPKYISIFAYKCLTVTHCMLNILYLYRGTDFNVLPANGHTRNDRNNDVCAGKTIFN